MSTSSRESGQAAIPLVVFFAVLLLAAAGLAVDLSDLWFHRQAAQAAADSACQAASLDLLVAAAGETLNPGFTPGQAGTCTATSTSSVCLYAKYNGYNSAGPSTQSGSGTSAWNTVSYSFPSAVTGVTAPPASMTSTPYLQVGITESVQTFLLQLVPGLHFSQVKAQCTCGLAEVKEPAPMIVLDPKPDAFTYSGGASLNIIGGPQRGLQVNSSSASAVTCSGSGVINTSLGGPSGTGSDVGIVGNEPENSNGCVKNGGYLGFAAGSTGNWRPNVLPITDPFATVNPPSSVKSMVPATFNSGKYPQNIWVAYGIDGCPDHSSPAYVGQTANNVSLPSNCAEFAPGYYPNGIQLPYDYSTVIFVPGVYYVNGSFQPGGSNTIRVAMPCWGTYLGGYSASACSPVAKANNLRYSQGAGVMFYFLSGTFSVSGGSSGDIIDSVPSQELTCDGTIPLPSLHMPALLTNNVLWGQCTQNGTYYDAGEDTTDTPATPGTRGILFFQAHSNTASPTFAASGTLSFAGSLYFHSSSNGDVLNLSGAASSGTFIIGDIITDQVNLSGSGAINLAIPKTLSAPMLKVAAFQ